MMLLLNVCRWHVYITVHVNPNTTSDEVICCAYVCLMLMISLLQAVNHRRTDFWDLSLSFPSFPRPHIRRSRCRDAHTNATSTPSSSVETPPSPLHEQYIFLEPLPLPPCPRPQQQPGSPLQSAPTSCTACSCACAPSSRLARYSNPG